VVLPELSGVGLLEMWRGPSCSHSLSQLLCRDLIALFLLVLLTLLRVRGPGGVTRLGDSLGEGEQGLPDTFLVFPLGVRH